MGNFVFILSQDVKLENYPKVRIPSRLQSILGHVMITRFIQKLQPQGSQYEDAFNGQVNRLHDSSYKKCFINPDYIFFYSE